MAEVNKVTDDCSKEDVDDVKEVDKNASQDIVVESTKDLNIESNGQPNGTNETSGQTDNQNEQEQTKNVQSQNKNKNRGQKRRQRNNVARLSGVPIQSLFPVPVVQDSFDLRNVLSGQGGGDAGAWWHRHQTGYQQVKKPRTDNNWKKKNQNTSEKTEEPIEDILNQLKYAVVATDYPTTLLNDDQFNSLQTLLMEEILKIEDEESIPRFWRSYLRHGSLLMFLADDKSKEWLVNIVPTLILTNDIKLKTGPAKDLILTRKLNVTIPKLLNDLDEEQILKLLKNQNTGLRCELWQILSCQNEEKGRMFTIAIDEESFKNTRNSSFKAHLGLGIIKFTNVQYFNVIYNSTN